MGRLELWHILLVSQLIGISSSTGPPRLIGSATQQVTARVSSVIKLPCPVEADPAALMQWFKDKYLIHQGWDRFKVTQKWLKIKEIVMEDAGHYVCKAINGFGSVSINITLRVVDGSTSMKKHNLFPQTPHEDHKMGVVKPRFSYPDKMRRTTVDRPTGSSVRFKCKAVGHPHPKITWFKDGQPLTTEDLGEAKKTRWTLKLHGVTKESSGRYTCRVSNSEGAINYTYTLQVIEKIKTKPEILPPHPMNITVKFASTASFQCRVKSVVQPHIQWLKRVEDEGDQVNQNTTIVVKGHSFIVLQTGSVLHTTDGAYLNKLVIPRATEADAGMYICLGANSMGYSYREAFLIVGPDPSRSRVTVPPGGSSGGSSLALVIALPSVLGFVLIGVVIYLIQQRQRGCSSRSPAGQRFPVPTHDKDVYPAVHNPHMYPVGHNGPREKFSKPYSAVDYYTDISSASRTHPTHHQHQHTHYNY